METASNWDEAIQCALDLLDKQEVEVVATINRDEYQRKQWFALFESQFREAVDYGILPRLYPAHSFRMFVKDMSLQGRTVKELVIVYLQEGETL